MLFKNIKL